MDDTTQHRGPERVHKYLSRFSLVQPLEAHLSEYAGPFSWNRHCISFCGDWVRKVTGSDPLAGWPTCTNAEDAARILQKRGFVNLLDAVSSALPERDVSRVRVGDIVAREFRNEIAIGIATGRRAAFLGLRRLEFVNVSTALRAWSVD